MPWHIHVLQWETYLCTAGLVHIYGFPMLHRCAGKVMSTNGPAGASGNSGAHLLLIKKQKNFQGD